MDLQIVLYILVPTLLLYYDYVYRVRKLELLLLDVASIIKSIQKKEKRNSEPNLLLST